MSNENQKRKKTFIVHWTEHHRGTIQARSLKEAKRIAENGLDGIKEHPRHIITDNIYVEE